MDETSQLLKLFLRPSGWIESRGRGTPVLLEGGAVPWFTYGAIEFVHRVVRQTDRVFEYGAGNGVQRR
jgi:hypothetical protein